MYHEMITTIWLVNTSIPSHNYPMCMCVRGGVSFKIYFLNNTQEYNTVFLTIFTVLYLRSPELIHLIIEYLYLISPFPDPGNHHSTLCFYEFSFFPFHTKRVP